MAAIIFTILASAGCSPNIDSLDSPENTIHRFYHGVNQRKIEIIRSSMTDKAFQDFKTSLSLGDNGSVEELFDRSNIMEVRYSIETVLDLNEDARIIILRTEYGNEKEEESFLVVRIGPTWKINDSGSPYRLIKEAGYNFSEKDFCIKLHHTEEDRNICYFNVASDYLMEYRLYRSDDGFNESYYISICEVFQL